MLSSELKQNSVLDSHMSLLAEVIMLLLGSRLETLGQSMPRKPMLPGY